MYVYYCRTYLLELFMTLLTLKLGFRASGMDACSAHSKPLPPRHRACPWKVGQRRARGMAFRVMMVLLLRDLLEMAFPFSVLLQSRTTKDLTQLITITQPSRLL